MSKALDFDLNQIEARITAVLAKEDADVPVPETYSFDDSAVINYSKLRTFRLPLEERLLRLFASPCRHCKAKPGEPCFAPSMDTPGVPYPVGVFHIGGRSCYPYAQENEAVNPEKPA